MDDLNPETKQNLLKIENHLTLLFSNLIKDGFKEIKDSITELFNKDIEYMKDTQSRFSQHHNEHFDNNKKALEEIVKTKESIDERVHLIVDNKIEILESKLENLTNNQIACAARRTENRAIEEKTDMKKNTNYALITLLIVIGTALGAIGGKLL